jgi:ribose transport system substrate-binding protein
MSRSIALFLSLAAVAGCGKEEAGTRPPAAAKGTIGLSVLTLTNPFFKVIADSLTAAAAKSGYDVSVVSGEFDVARQQNQVKDFIVRKVRAIVLTPCDSKAIGPVIQEANAAGIPVFTADIACLDPAAKVVCHIATDNYQGGRMAGDAMIEALGGKGKVAIIDHPVAESVIQRTKGFREVLERAKELGKSTIEIVATLPGGGARDQGFKVAEDLLQSHADLAGIFAINDPSALGAVAALEKAGRLDRVKVVGFDGQPDGKRAILEGKIYADPVQFPDQIGSETFKVIQAHFAGESLAKEKLIDTVLYRRADAEKDPELRK